MPRAAQKARTKRDLVVAAIGLVHAGEVPTLETTAAAADVSRATAYRYFPTRGELLETAYREAVIEPMERALAAVDRSGDAEERLDILIGLLCEGLLEYEQALREMLRASVMSIGIPGTAETPLRRGRRSGWIERALDPIRGELKPHGFDRAVSAIAAGSGIEAFIVLRDIRRLTPAQACETIRWTAQALLRSARVMDRADPLR